MANKRLLTDEEMFKIEDELDPRPMPFLLKHRPVSIFDDRIRKAQDKKTLQEVGEWLDKHTLQEIVRAIKTFQRGEMPK